MDIKKRILLTVAVGLVLVAVFIITTKAITEYTGFFVYEKNSENCLEKQDITLYVNTADIITLKEMKIFDYMGYIKIINCFRNKELCSSNGVDSFPMWIINGEKRYGDIDYQTLLEYSKC